MFNGLIEKSVGLRDVAQLGSAPALGAGCRRFKSYHPDFLRELKNVLDPVRDHWSTNGREVGHSY